MKIVICYPPLSTEKGFPTLGQNRQFQLFKDPTLIYPVVPAQAATLLKRSGYEVYWLDCIAEGVSYPEFIERLSLIKPGLIAMETKTPVVRQHWRIIDDIKQRLPDSKTALFGDHVTALPEESFQNSKVDFVLTGGDYDFLLLNLANSISQSMKLGLEPGVYYRQDEEVKNSGPFKLDHDLNSLPFIDRELTQWWLYSYKNGNYKRTPGTYIMSGRDCWWGKCTFCGWAHFYPQFRSRSAENVLDEIGLLIDRYKVREIMDDTGSFPAGEWLRKFCRGAIKRGYNKKIYLDCNMRFGALNNEDLKLMKEANFRLLLFGLESANQKTLERIDKGLKVEDIIEGCKSARQAGLYPHITIMFGYPWESYEEALKTLELGRWLLKKGYAYTMQATVVIPYPGTPLFKECREEGLLNTMDWDKYDMKQPVMRTPFSDEKVMALAQSMYGVSFEPEFIFRKILSVRDFDDLRYYFRALRKVSAHIFDFRHRGGK